MTLQQEAITAISTAEFRPAWPVEVRKVLVKAAKTEGDMPPYAEKEVKWALKTARGVERKCAKDIEAGIAALPPKERRQLLGV